MEVVILAGMWAALVLPATVIMLAQGRQISSLQKSNSELAATLGELARVEHGVPPAMQPQPHELAEVEKMVRDIYGSVPQMAFPRAETLDDPSLEQDPNQLGEWDVPPGLLDAAGDEDMT